MPQDNGQQLGERDAKAEPRRKRVFRLAQDEDLSGEKAPRYAGKQVSISTTFDRKNGDGVIVAQGGDKQGYALYIRDGRLILGVRDHWKLTEAVSGEPLDAGVSDVVASIGRKERWRFLLMANWLPGGRGVRACTGGRWTAGGDR